MEGEAGGAGKAPAQGKQDPSISEEEQALLELLPGKIPEEDAQYLHDIVANPSRLVKFVRARSLNEAKILKMLHKTAEFRKERCSPDGTFLKGFKHDEYFKHALFLPVHYLRDRDGGLVLVHRTGQFHGRWFCKHYSEEYLVKLVAYALEVLTHDAMAHMQKTGAAPYITFVLDFQGYGGHVLGPMGLTQTLVNVFQSHYPETMKRAVIINSPWFFRAVWAVIQAFLDPVVKGKITLVGGSGARKAVDQIMTVDQIPAWMGGEYTHNGDEFSSDVISPGGKPVTPDLPSGQKYIDQPVVEQ